MNDEKGMYREIFFENERILAEKAIRLLFKNFFISENILFKKCTSARTFLKILEIFKSFNLGFFLKFEL